jgi:hypothetical protein
MTSTPPQQPEGTTGVIHIAREASSGALSRFPVYQYVLSFGGTEDGVGAFNLGRAFGLDDLVKQLRKVGLSQGEMDTALQVLAAQAHHKIPDVKLTKTLIHKFGL